eukprot:Seg6674.3 transcript_id=Seg6674.3/GoldUCD/mRNA.D3Y31 product="hypothetical protein" protein_id=Seg6674.3/GoldUCD/D3Y31
MKSTSDNQELSGKGSKTDSITKGVSLKRNAAKDESINCRVCGESTVRQNYGCHLKRAHPTEDCNDLRPKQQRSMEEWFGSSTVNKDAAGANETESIAEEAHAILFRPSIDIPECRENENFEVHFDATTDYNIRSTKSSLASCDGNKLEKIFQINKAMSQKINELSEEVKLLKLGKDAVSPVSEARKGKVATKEIFGVTQLLSSCRSMSDITARFTELVYLEEKGCLICDLCVGDKVECIGIRQSRPGVFLYDKVLSLHFAEDDMMSEKFRNLKKHVAAHLETQMHTRNLQKEAENEAIIDRRETRERLIGEKLGAICYYLYMNGRPDSDFPELVLLHSLNCVDIGFRPCGKVLADKATHKQRTRQFVSFVTVIPDSESLIHTISLDVVVVKAHRGPDIKDSLVSVLSTANIVGDQYLGGSYDGQYHHLSVPFLLDTHFGFTDDRKYSDWDRMHKAGTVEAHIRKDQSFSWLVEVTDTVGRAFKSINWGQEFEHFFEVAERLKADDSFSAQVFRGLPCFYSETKFANHCAGVYKQLWKDYPAIIVTCEETQLEKSQGSARDRQKAEEARILKNQLFNKQFVTRLSGICDIYSVFGHGVNVLQIVDILPHERFDRFEEVCIQKLDKMANAVPSMPTRSSCSKQGISEEYTF